MTKKFLISLLFFVVFILLISVSDKVSAFVFEVDGNSYDTNGLNIRKYNIVYYFDSSKSEIDIISSDSPIVANEKISDNKYNCSLEDSLSYYYLMISRGYWQPYPGEHDSISTSFDKSLILYLDYDICDSEGNVIFNGTNKPDKFFNFRYGTLDYSINLTANNNNINFLNYTCIFKADNYLFIYTAKDKPTYKYKNYRNYLHNDNSVYTYLYDLKTDTVLRGNDLTKVYSSSSDIAFDLNELVYSDFSLYKDFNMYEGTTKIFGDTGKYLGDYDMNGTASGNISAGGRSSEGNSALSDYINSQKPDYNGSSNQGSDTISGGFNNVYGNFGFAEDVKKNVNGMISVITNTSEAPKFQINVNSKYYKGTLTIVDLSWYAPYKEIGDNVICIFAYLGFLWRIFIRLPDIIRGAGADSYAGDMGYEIGLWNKYGMGRSSSPRSITERKQSLSAYVFKRR